MCSAKLGEKELHRWRIEDREEMEKEATIKEKIRMRKKERQRRGGKPIEGWIQASQRGRG